MTETESGLAGRTSVATLRVARRSLLLAAAFSLAASSYASARGPDLVVSSASKAPKSVNRGSKLRFRAVVANRGGAKAGRSQVRLYLSTNRRWSTSDIELTGGRAVGPLPARRRANITASVRVPRDAPPARRFFVLVCADAAQTVNESNELNNCRAAGRTVVVGGSSIEVIDADVLLRKLRPDQALLYKLFAVFGDRRLPKRYRGDGTSVSGTSVVEEAVERLPSLSPAIQGQVRRFLIPPIYQGSFATRAADRAQFDPSSFLNACTVRSSDWDSVETGNGVARIWWRKAWPEDAADANRLKGEFDRAIYPTLTAITTGHAPLPDGAAPCPGPDSKLDIYLWPMGSPDDGATVGFCPAPTTSYVVIHPRAPRAVLAHEFMHVLQNTYKGFCGAKWKYLADATATWAEDRVYHFDQSEHQYHELVTDPGEVFGYGFGYPGWAFIYSATRHASGDAGAVRRLFELAASTSDPLDALDAALPNHLEGAWPAFARDAWNRPLLPDALKQSFFNWDSWRVRPQGRPSTLRLDGKEFTLPLPIGLTGLGRQYRDLRFDDGTAREITFKDPSAAGVDPHLHTTAFLKFAGGRWRAEDWTGRDKVQFCRDDKEEDVREVVLVHSTSRRPPPGDPESTVTESDKPTLVLRDRCEVGAVIHLRGSDSLTITNPGCPGQDQYNASWGLEAKFSLPKRLPRSDEIGSTTGSGSGTINEALSSCREPETRTFALSWPASEAGDDVGLRLSPAAGGIRVEVILLPNFTLVGAIPQAGGSYWMPYFVLGACVGPHGTIPEKKLGSRHISVPLSGSCDKTVESGDHEHLVSSAGGTLEIRR